MQMIRIQNNMLKCQLTEYDWNWMFFSRRICRGKKICFISFAIDDAFFPFYPLKVAILNKCSRKPVNLPQNVQL